MRETSKRALADADLQRTAEVSLTALLETSGFYHPVSQAKPAGAIANTVLCSWLHASCDA